MARNPNVSRSHWRAPSGAEYRIVDAEPGTIMWITPNADDIAAATSQDPNNCALAQCWMRTHDVPDAQIGIDKCMLPLRRGKEIIALRMKTTADTRRVIDEFDKTGKFPVEGFALRGIPKSERMESQRNAVKRSRERWETLKTKPVKKARQKIHLRNASRRAQTVRS